MSYRRGGERFDRDRREEFPRRPDYRGDRPYQSYDREQRDRDFDVRRTAVSKPVNELDREVLRGITEASGARRERFEDRGDRGPPRSAFHRPDFHRGGGPGGYERRFPPRGRDNGNFRNEPYGRRPPPFKGGFEERTNFHSRGPEIDRNREDDDRSGSQRTLNIFDPAVVPKRGFYFEHDNRGAGGDSRRGGGRPDSFRRGGYGGDRERFGRDNNNRDRDREMYDPRRERRQYDSRPAPEGWRQKPDYDRDIGEGSNGRSFNRDRFRKPDRTEGRWTHDMYEAEDHQGRSGAMLQ